ncbi:hypothetical protein M4951_19225 [Blastopirellula sp. J2-11]|uniref:hypothetical protein n=1 Tax=Blastopirellula sp. J2-11 TaxID=2943192 RepID=UPI0021C8A1EF|nr:hypothetical protein [Blastopirellula sp. J2-11]UUO05500.1 hypothetical protein M4951_19225 [Blastopirellula sp. J2-11]
MSFLGLRSLVVLLVCIPTLSFADGLPGPCDFASYEASNLDVPAVATPIADYAKTDWVNKAIRDCLEPNRTKPCGGSRFSLNVAQDLRGGNRPEVVQYELELAWQKVSELFWESPENPADFRLAQFDLRMKSLISRSLEGWLPHSHSASVAVAETVTEKELAAVEEFILDEEYAQIVAARPLVEAQLQDDCPPMPPVVENFALESEGSDSDMIEPNMVDEVVSLLQDEESPLTDEEIAYLHSGPSDFVNSLDPYGYSEYNEYLEEEAAETPHPEQGAAWTVAIATQIVAATRSTQEGLRWIGNLNLTERMEAARHAHQEREIRSYRTAERQVLERWDAVIDGFELLR